MTAEAIAWLANHTNGPNEEKKPFGCFWCGGTVTVHRYPCPAYDAIHALDQESDQGGS